MEDETCGVNAAAENLARRFEKEGIDLRLLEEPFLEAAELGDADSLRQRLSALDADQRRSFLRAVDQQGRTGLLLAAQRGSADVARVLLDAGANPNEADSSGATALHYAGGRGALETIEHLLHCKAEVDRPDDQGETPLMWCSSARVTRALLAAGADASLRSARGRTALALAAARGDVPCLEILAALPGADLAAEDAEGRTAHDLAQAAGETGACDVLVAHGAVPSAAAAGAVRLTRRDEALVDAARRGDADGLLALLRAGAAAEVDADVAGETALLAAAAAGAGRAVEALLEARADPNLADPFLKETPLLRAAQSRCSPELLWLLLEARADPLLSDLSGRRPADIAAMWGDAVAEDILKAAAAGTLDLAGLD